MQCDTESSLKLIFGVDADIIYNEQLEKIVPTSNEHVNVFWIIRCKKMMILIEQQPDNNNKNNKQQKILTRMECFL